MAKPTAGYSQIAEVNDGKIIYIEATARQTTKVRSTFPRRDIGK
jgi:phosphoribosylformylglycinamidine (FGAM) synthase PurS component